MDALNLDPGSYQGTYKLVGGRLSLDLVNTVSWPGAENAHDWLGSRDNLQRWMEAVNLQSSRGNTPGLPAVIDIRSVLAKVLRPLAHGDVPAQVAMDVFNQYVSEAASRRIIDKESFEWTWKPPQSDRDVFAPVIFDAAELVSGGKLDRLRSCPACDWLFEDQTRNGRRRWCDMGDCGSRDKSRRYYHRQRQP